MANENTNMTWPERCKAEALAWACLVEKATEGMAADRVLTCDEVNAIMGYLDNAATTVGALRNQAAAKRAFYK